MLAVSDTVLVVGDATEGGHDLNRHCHHEHYSNQLQFRKNYVREADSSLRMQAQKIPLGANSRQDSAADAAYAALRALANVTCGLPSAISPITVA
jgi:hypothetical protein